MSTQNRSPRASIMGLPISLEERPQILATLARVIEQGEPGHYISITNTESMYHGLRDGEHGRYIRGADLSLCDGVGVIVAGWAWGQRIQRYNGPVLQLDASQYGLKRTWRHFFYGGKEGVAEEMARRLKRRFPGLVVCGCYCPPRSPRLRSSRSTASPSGSRSIRSSAAATWWCRPNRAAGGLRLRGETSHGR